MISNREIKDQIEQLNEQNQTLSDELMQIKQLLQEQKGNKNKGGQGGGRSKNGDESGNGQESGSFWGGSADEGSSDQGGDGITQLAGDFSKLKDLTSQLEKKTKQLIEENSSGQPLTNEDAVQLVLYIMNGMIDWTMELCSKSSGGGAGDSSGQLQ